MIALNSEKPVVIVFVQDTGRRIWLSNVHIARDASYRSVLQCYFDDDPRMAKVLDRPYAETIQRRLLQEGDVRHGRLRVRLAHGPNEVFVDDEASKTTPSASRLEDARTRHFVPLDESSRGFIVTPGFSTEGACWYVKASDVPAFQGKAGFSVESVRGNTPAAAAERARDIFGPETMYGDPDAAAKAAARLAAEQQEAKQNQNTARIRPGSWRY